MVHAIGSSAVSGAVFGFINSGAAAASLDAQLVRYQKQLSECVNCESSKTAEGKAEIQAISGKISEVRERIDKVMGMKSSSQTDPIALSTSREGGANSGAAITAEKDDAIGKPVSTATAANAIVGSLVNVFA